jgi:hypothetical protein
MAVPAIGRDQRRFSQELQPPSMKGSRAHLVLGNSVFQPEYLARDDLALSVRERFQMLRTCRA